MIDWIELAKQAIAAGYQRRNPWETQYQTWLVRNRPRLVKEFSAARLLGSYVVVQVNNAMKLADRLERQGTPPETAQELALAELMPDTREKVTEWEREGAEQDIMAAVGKYLTHLSESGRPPKNRPA